MSNKINTILTSALGVVFLFSGMAFARMKQIDVLFPAMVGKNLKLKPGDYKIDVVNNKKSPAVKFYNKDGKLVGQAPVKLVNEASKNHQTQVAYTHDSLERSCHHQDQSSGLERRPVFFAFKGSQGGFNEIARIVVPEVLWRDSGPTSRKQCEQKSVMDSRPGF